MFTSVSDFGIKKQILPVPSKSTQMWNGTVYSVHYTLYTVLVSYSRLPIPHFKGLIVGLEGDYSYGLLFRFAYL